MHLDVFGPSMEVWVPSEVNTTDVVAVEENRILRGNTVLDSVTLGCFLLLQDMAPQSSEKTKPDIDCLSTL